MVYGLDVLLVQGDVDFIWWFYGLEEGMQYWDRDLGLNLGFYK